MQDEPAYETATQLYINQEECIDCGACISTCESNAIFPAEELPEDKMTPSKRTWATTRSF
jgi:NAD-dependent dihydropyrimidine dehydrogenase PreA subunit